jgi:hypothetical protein
MTRRMRTLATAVAGSIMGLALAACGSDGGGDGGGDDFADGSVDDIKEAAIADMKALESMTMEGSLTQEAGELELTLSMDTGGNCLGTIKQGGGTAEFLGTDGGFFLKGDETFWRGSTDPAKADAVVKLVGDKWVNMGADGGGFSDLCDLDSMIDDFDDEDDAGKEYSVGDETTVNGENAVEVVTKEGEETTTALVATEGKHYILKVTNEGGDEPGSFTLSEFDEPVDAEAPDDAVELPKSE